MIETYVQEDRHAVEILQCIGEAWLVVLVDVDALSGGNGVDRMVIRRSRSCRSGRVFVTRGLPGNQSIAPAWQDAAASWRLSSPVGIMHATVISEINFGSGAPDSLNRPPDGGLTDDERQDVADDKHRVVRSRWHRLVGDLREQCFGTSGGIIKLADTRRFGRHGLKAAIARD